ncbi:MAG: ChaN family lipoprotein [Pseudomonadota bacterium]
MRILLVVLALGAMAGAAVAMAAAPQAAACVPSATWRVPGGDSAALTTGEVLARIQGSRVVLLGETHDNAEHHRWQLAMLAALHARQPDLVLGLEMFPRRVQPVLDRWVAGELTEAEFLRQAQWQKVWRFDPALYLPLFHFARMNRLPMVALNVEQRLIRDVGDNGFERVDEAKREGVTRPAPPRAAYLARLRPVFDQHRRDGISGKGGGDAEAQFNRFVESQQVWDRAMAQGIADALARHPGATVVGIMGSGHIVHGHGVPHQLRDLGVQRVASLLPWDADDDCDELKNAGIADAVFGVAAPPRSEAAAERPRLGVWLDPAEGGVKVREVVKGSVAEASGLQADDVITEIAGAAARQPADVSGAVQRQAPGTWLPIKVTRGGQTVEIVAKFPPPAR